MLGRIFDLTLQEFRHARSGHIFIVELLFYGFICKKKNPKILISIEINFDFHINQCKLQIFHRNQCKLQILQDFLVWK